MKNYFKYIVLIIISFTSCLFTYYFNKSNFVLISSIIFFYSFYFYNTILKKMKNENKSMNLVVMIFSLLFSLFFMFGYNLENFDIINFDHVLIICTLSISLTIFPILLLLCDFLKNKFYIQEHKISNKKLIIILSTIIFVGSLLIYLAYFPGLYGYDGGFELLEFIDKNVQITTHFSILYSFIFSSIVKLGNYLFGSYFIGFALYSALQLIIINVINVFSCYKIYKITNNYVYAIISSIFLAFFPFIKIIEISTCQDALFGSFFVLVLIKVYDFIFSTSKKSIKEKSKLFIVTTIFCLFKNTGFYVLLLYIILLGIINFKKSKKIILIIMLALLSYKVIEFCEIKIFNAVKGNSIREISSIPSQQIARTMNLSNNINANEKHLINELYQNLDFNIYEYHSEISDNTKGSLNTELLLKNKYKYLKLYFILLYKNPKVFFEASIFNSLGLWYIDKKYPDSRMYHPLIESTMLDAKFWNKNYISIERKSLFTPYENILTKLVTNSNWLKIPVINILFRPSTYFWTLLLILIISTYEKKKELISYLLLPICFIISIFLSPVIIFRYLYPLVISMPLTIIIFLKNKKYTNK